jgi:tetratricopeptide (TPR) repeat protein
VCAPEPVVSRELSVTEEDPERFGGWFVVDATLVTIHGFWSTPETWDRLNAIWNADEQLRGLRIYRFGYRSPKKPRLPLSPTRIPDYDDIAQALATEYMVELKRASEVAIITHSQGGLILQRFLTWMLQQGRGRELARIRSIVMLACPNGGSEYLRSIRRALGFGRHPQAGSLKVLNRQVADTQRTVLERVVNAAGVDDHQCRIPFHVYAGDSDEIVTASSAQGAFPGAAVLAGNHFSILDPAAPGNRTAATVVHHLLADLAVSSASAAGSGRSVQRGDGNADLPPSPEAKAPQQLPMTVRDFTGRAGELEKLTSLLEEAAPPGGTMVIAIDGTAGIGKTALAVQWAHQVAGRFPDGQLYVDLRGFDPAGPPMEPAEAVRGFLDAFEVPAERIPVSLDAQAALYRSLLAGRRVLVVLDNARDADQVQRLLPGSPDSTVVVTSRKELTGLVAAKGAVLLTLDVLSHAEADEMLARRLGRDRAAAEPQAVQQIIARCARLPLALSIVVARAAAHQDFPLADLAEELRDAERRLPALDAGEAAANVMAVFSWSYQQLSEQEARMFRLLGLHPGPDITAPAAASLAATPLTDARLLMDKLDRANLITQRVPGRFTFHDLLREYAARQTRTLDSSTDQNAARQRMLDHYLHTAQAAWSLSYPHLQRPITLASPLAGVTPEEPADYPAAWAWFTAEYPVLLAAIQLAATGHYTYVWQLPHALVPFFERQGHWHDFARTHDDALTAAEEHADQQGQAHTHLGIGHRCTRRGRLDEARPHLQDALRLFEELGDPAGEAVAHSWLGLTFQIQQRYEEALADLQQAVDLARTGGYQRSIAAALNGLGWFHALRGNGRLALLHCQQSLDLYHDIGDRWGEFLVLDSIGYAHHRLRNHRQAVGYFEQSLNIAREFGDLYKKATVYEHLGDAHHADGNTTQAHDAWQQALGILHQLVDVPSMGVGYANQDEIRAKLQTPPP